MKTGLGAFILSLSLVLGRTLWGKKKKPSEFLLVLTEPNTLSCKSKNSNDFSNMTEESHGLLGIW